MNRLTLITACLIILATCSGTVPGNLVLLGFESDAELDLLHWKCHTLFSISDEHVTHGKKSLRMELYPSDYPGLNPKLEVNDWKKYGTLNFDIYNPEKEETMITVRIDDQKEHPDYADRYNMRFILKPGLNLIRIPLDSLITSGTHRQLNLTKIYKFLIFMVHPQRKYVLYIDHVRLVP